MTLVASGIKGNGTDGKGIIAKQIVGAEATQKPPTFGNRTFGLEADQAKW